MEVVWTLENVKNNKDFYRRFSILLLITSVSLWRKYHPTHKLVFYCDKMSYDVLYNLNIFYLWDEIRDLKYDDKINRETFWSSSKTKIISETKIPLLVIDHDFLIFRNIDDILNDRIIYTYDETIEHAYPFENSIINIQLTTPVSYNIPLASNVSFFYLPNPEFSRRYGIQVLKNHAEISAMPYSISGSKYMILSEQLMLKNWLVSENIKHSPLSKQIWNCTTSSFTKLVNNDGIWEESECYTSFKHYGGEEVVIYMTGGNLYNDNCEYLYRCINSCNLINIKELKKILNTIQNR